MTRKPKASAIKMNIGIKETPAFGCPTVNIVSRQCVGLRAENVLDACYDADAVAAATRRCLFDDAFRSLCRSVANPYGLGDAGVHFRGGQFGENVALFDVGAAIN